MLFNALDDSAKRRELIIVRDGIARVHLRKDKQLTISEIYSLRKGAGSRILRRLEQWKGAESIFAKCPAHLPSNAWYARKGFILEGQSRTRNGKLLNHWRKPLPRCWKPNVAHNIELVYCASGNPRLAEIAIEEGWLYGYRAPGSAAFQPYFMDQDWKSPDREKYMKALEKYRPWMATVLDLEREDQLQEVLDWAEEAAQWTEMVIIIPKVHGVISKLPTSIGGKPIRLGYSVPTRYGGTDVPLSEFANWPHGVHLLGGAPNKQLQIADQIDVRSVDTNYHAKVAAWGQFFTLEPDSGGRARHWPKFREVGIEFERPMYEAFRVSCMNIYHAWNTR